jgi:predicted nucleic acid-binding protein
MLVVSDTSPLTYLLVIDAIEVLPEVFGQVSAPPAVLAELKRSRRAELQPVRDWATSPPEWLIIRSPSQLDDTLPRKLGPGEAEALSLAQEIRADRVLLDDRDAREAAQARHLQIAGTLAVLEEAACRDLIDMDQAIKKLRGTNYRATDELYQSSLERVRQRRRAEEQARTSERANAAPKLKASPRRGTTRKKKPGGR